MVGEVFVLFVPTAISNNAGSYTIDVLIESHAERIFKRAFLSVSFLFIGVMVNLAYPLIFIHRS